MRHLRLWLACLATGVTGCVSVRRAPPPPPPEVKQPALIAVEPASWPDLSDDDVASLHEAVQKSLEQYASRGLEQAESLRVFLTILGSSTDTWKSRLAEHFTLYQSSGADSDHRVTFSAYYEPSIDVRDSPQGAYRFPLYRRPHDLIDVDLGRFDSAYSGARISGRVQGRDLVPYPSRADIDSKSHLKGKGLEIAWAKDPLEVLYLQIEGTGWLDWGNGSRSRIRFDGTNGLKFRSVGQNLINTGRIPKAEFNRKRMEQYLASHVSERQALLNINERYVFFRLDTGASQDSAIGNIGVPLTPWRSIATDPRIFPKGALAWIDVEESSGTRRRRFVLNQDEGGAIRGPGRVDYFVGGGEKAEPFAWNFWQPGKLYFLLKKKASSSGLQKSSNP